MKVFQIENDICYWEATKQFPTVESTIGFFPPDVKFIEAPDTVFEGWGYLDGEFIKPTPQKGWLYDDKTGTFYPEGELAPSKIPTELELAQQDITDLQLNDIEQGQQMTDLELTILGGVTNV